MSSNREKLKTLNSSAFLKDSESLQNFESLSASGRERVITQLHTIGSKAETRRFDALLRDSDSGMMKLM